MRTDYSRGGSISFSIWQKNRALIGLFSKILQAVAAASRFSGYLPCAFAKRNTRLLIISDGKI